MAAWSQRERSCSSSGDELAGGADAGVAAGVVKEHEGEQAEILWRLGEEIAEYAGEADGLGGELAADEGVAGGGAVALVEDEVEDGLDGGEALGQGGGGGDLVGDAGFVDLAFGADDALGEGGLGEQEGAGDLGGGEAAEGTQGEADAGFFVERGMAAGEDEAEAIVFAGGGFHVELGRGAGGGGSFVEQLVFAGAAGMGAAGEVDEAAAGGGVDPGAGVVGDTVSGPVGEGGGEGVLEGFFGEIEGARGADESGDDLSGLAAEDGLDGSAEIVHLGRGGFGDLVDGADFDIADGAAAGGGDAGGPLESVVEVGAIEDVVAGELLLGFGEGAVGDERFAVVDAHGGGGGGGGEGVGGAEDAAAGGVLHEGGVGGGGLLQLGGGGGLVFLAVDEHHVAHGASRNLDSGEAGVGFEFVDLRGVAGGVAAGGE